MNGPDQSFRAALRADIMSTSSSGAAEALGEELSEDDIWNGDDDAGAAEDRDQPTPAMAMPSGEPSFPPLRIINRGRTDANHGPLDAFGKHQGLAVISAPSGFGRAGSGQGPGVGFAGDIVGPGLGVATGVGFTPSVVIPRVAPARDPLKPMRRASAPVNVPDWTKITGSAAMKPPPHLLADEDEPEQGGMIPPHELVARDYAKSVTFSVYEGVGRTLRGRDLDHVRSAVLRKTGFIDSIDI